ncbi:hypothetical protein [Gilliamella sp. ESL0250]|uniref:hypothetical protein n=1 Tax=Gilliamella sp. ESL0250 TaxID=2705036 RepID=UPI001580CBD0|nr:hypothetical protein [Gilliamella sp. ESL0250]NUF50244.1 hypothetical protein [Gilliamella sp. ESL0250]
MAFQYMNKMLAFSIVNSNLTEIESIIQNGLNWPYEPQKSRKLIEEIHLNIQKGGALPPVGAFYYSCVNDNKLIFVSNSSDGWDSLLYCITEANHSSYLSFRILSGAYPLIEMSFTDSGETVRLVRAMKEDKWLFYEKGDLLWFEDKEQYNKKRIRDRVTYDLLLSYSKKNDIDFSSSNFFKTKKESLWVYTIR